MIEILLATFLHAQTHAYESTWVDREQAEQVAKALDHFYNQCGQFPDALEKLFEVPVKGECDRPGGEPALKTTNTNRDTVSKMRYTPFGYHDYELTVRLFGTRPD